MSIHDYDLTNPLELDFALHTFGELSEDALDQYDTISLSDALALEEQNEDAMKIAGISENTAVDTFLEMNGTTRFIVHEDEDYEYQ